MPDFDTYTCSECGDQFAALPGANAAETGHCSPACESSAKGLD